MAVEAATAPSPEQKRAAAYERMRSGPILETLVALSAPNLIALASSTLITIAETTYVGRLGVPALAGVALVFPVMMLMQMLSGGAMGGAISGAVSRALGAGDVARAQALALCAVTIGVAAGLSFALLVWLAGPAIFAAMGGKGAELEAAVTFSRVSALGIVAIWLANSMSSVLRGTGNMTAPAAIILAAGVGQICVGGAFGLGIGPAPRLGLPGVAMGQVVGFAMASVLLLLMLRAPSNRARLRFDKTLLSRERFTDILRVGLIAALSPIQSVLAILILTALVARFGTEALAGYGIGTRLEFLLIPIAFSVGIACVPMVGTAVGAGDITRARKIAWTAGALAMGALTFIAAIAIAFPDAWGRLFVQDERVLETTRLYLRIASFGFPFFGLGLCLYFASQGAGRVVGPILAQTARLAIIVIGGFALASAQAPLWTLFALTAVAMLALGLGAAAAVKFTPWRALH